jgi:hypothetical protein
MIMEIDILTDNHYEQLHIRILHEINKLEKL